MLNAQNNKKIAGFIISKLMPAPEVYNSGGLTLMIDDESLMKLCGIRLDLNWFKKLKQSQNSGEVRKVLVVYEVLIMDRNVTFFKKKWG